MLPTKKRPGLTLLLEDELLLEELEELELLLEELELLTLQFAAEMPLPNTEM